MMTENEWGHGDYEGKTHKISKNQNNYIYSCGNENEDIGLIKILFGEKAKQQIKND